MGDANWVPENENIIIIIEKKFDNFLATEVVNIYDNYDILAREYRLH